MEIVHKLQQGTGIGTNVGTGAVTCIGEGAQGMDYCLTIYGFVRF